MPGVPVDDLVTAGDPVLPELSAASLTLDQLAGDPAAGERFNIQLSMLLTDSERLRELDWLAGYDWFSPGGTFNHEPVRARLAELSDNEILAVFRFSPRADPAPYVVSTIDGDTVTTGVFFWYGRRWGWAYARVVSTWSGVAWTCDDLRAAEGPKRTHIQEDWVGRYSTVRLDQMRRARIGTE